VTFGFGETVTLLSRTVSGRDADGNDVYTTVETPVPGSVFAPFGSTELIQGQDTSIQNPTIYLGDPTVIPKATDRVRRPNGEVYEIDGVPQVFPPNPFTGERVGAVLRLERVTG
jgi:hypothetical protein